MSETMQADPPKSSIEVTDDLVTTRQVLLSMVKALNESPKKSRERSLVVTKLQEAFMWAGEGLYRE